MASPVMTRRLAYSIGIDAGNKSMRANGRASWNEDDFNIASTATTDAMRLVPASKASPLAQSDDERS